MSAVIETSRELPTNVAVIRDDGGLLAAIARAASDPNVDVTKMERLYAIHESMVARDALMQFTEAMNAFKANPPRIVKGKAVSFGQTHYSHATLSDVCEAITHGLSQHGISHRWLTEQADGRVRVTCILTHRAGHSERTTLESAADQSGGKNAIQAIGSAVTYLQRYTLLAATGLSTADQRDDDAAGGDEPRITQAQADELQAMLDGKGLDIAKFKRWAKVERLGDILARNYAACVDAVSRR